MSEKLKITWLKPDNEMRPGQYFVAVKYPSGLGTYDILIWNGDEWEMDYTGEITGVVYIDDFLSSIKAGWPEWDDCSTSNN